MKPPPDIRLFEDGTVRDLSKEEWPGLWVAGWGFSGTLTALIVFCMTQVGFSDDSGRARVAVAWIAGVLYVYFVYMVRSRFDCQNRLFRAHVYRWLLLLYPFWILPALYMALVLLWKGLPLYRRMYDALQQQWQHFFG